MQLSLPCSIIINGQPTQGKSYLIRSMIYQLRNNFDHGVVFSNTANVGDNYNYIPSKRKYLRYSDDIMEDILASQLKLIEEGKPCRMFIIFDDILDAKFNGKTLTKLYTQYRHYNIQCLITATQYFNKLVPCVRETANLIFLFKCDNAITLRKFASEYMGEMTFEEARRFIMSRLKVKYTYLMVNKYSESKYLFGKAGAVPNYKLVF